MSTSNPAQTEKPCSSAEGVVTWSLCYARLGIKVLPLMPGGKLPLSNPSLGLRNGYKSASNDPLRIKRWWAAYPEANVGVVPPDDTIILDIDDAHAFATILLIAPELITAPRTRTGSGGYHLWARYPTHLKPLPLRARILKQYSLDIKGLGKSYVVAPPSLHPNGNMYRWEIPLTDLLHIPLLKDQTVYLLYGLYQSQRSKPPQASTPSTLPAQVHGKKGDDSVQRTCAYALAELRQRCQQMETTPAGQRHSELVRHATALWGWVNAGILTEQHLKELAAAARTSGLEEKEILGVLQWLRNVHFVRSLKP